MIAASLRRMPPRRLVLACSVALTATLLAVQVEGLADDKAAPPPADSAKPRINFGIGPRLQVGFLALNEKDQWTRLTYSLTGTTNSTVIDLDGSPVLFGALEKAVKAAPAPATKEGVAKPSLEHTAVWRYQNLRITQRVKVVRGKPVPGAVPTAAALDTCLLSYRLENLDEKPHRVGLRALVDTLINQNDGHPFAVPGKVGLVTVSADFRTREDMPTYVKALESADLARPGFVACFTLQVGPPFEAPNRFSITHLFNLPTWEVPLSPIDRDAAVVLYWEAKELRKGAPRDLAYGYGLGLASPEKDGGRRVPAVPP
jgi:hypothetical protein